MNTIEHGRIVQADAAVRTFTDQAVNADNPKVAADWALAAKNMAAVVMSLTAARLNESRTH